MHGSRLLNMGGGKRIGYIDAMRGFSMILVVFGHVLLMMGFPTDSTILGAVLMTFRMPLFFFVSGFFAFRPLDKWSSQLARSILKRKIQAQIICTLVFYSIFQLSHYESPLLFLDEGFSWFWFTIVLFQMFIIYMILAIVERLVKSKSIVSVGLIVISILSFTLYVKSIGMNNRIGNMLSWYYLTEYFQFFTVGVLAKKYYDIFVSCLESNKIRTIIIICYVIFLFVAYGFNRSFQNYNSAIYNMISMVFVRYAGLFTIFILFFNNQSYFASDDRTCRWLRFVGTRTLDIYMLHVFFLPNLTFLKSFLSANGMLLMQLTVGIIIAVLDVAVCLFISSILRSSSTLSQWLFGEKSKTGLKHAVLMP